MVEHLAERFFNEIVECSDVGIDDQTDAEMRDIKAYGLQVAEVEDTAEYTLAFDYDKLADSLFRTANKAYCLKRNRKAIYDLVKKYSKHEMTSWLGFNRLSSCQGSAVSPKASTRRLSACPTWTNAACLARKRTRPRKRRPDSKNKVLKTLVSV